MMSNFIILLKRTTQGEAENALHFYRQIIYFLFNYLLCE